MVSGRSEIASLDARVIASLNTLTILYNSSSMVLAVLVWLLIRKSLMAGQKWAFWALLFGIGFVEATAFIASAPIGNARWQVNVVLSALYVVGIGLSGYSLFKLKHRAWRMRVAAQSDCRAEELAAGRGCRHLWQHHC